jgi:hypothetical protein
VVADKSSPVFSQLCDQSVGVSETSNDDQEDATDLKLSFSHVAPSYRDSSPFLMLVIANTHLPISDGDLARQSTDERSKEERELFTIFCDHRDGLVKEVRKQGRKLSSQEIKTSVKESEHFKGWFGDIKIVDAEGGLCVPS